MSAGTPAASVSPVERELTSRNGVPHRFRHILATEPLTAEQITFLLTKLRRFRKYSDTP